VKSAVAKYKYQIIIATGVRGRRKSWRRKRTDIQKVVSRGALVPGGGKWTREGPGGGSRYKGRTNVCRTEWGEIPWGLRRVLQDMRAKQGSQQKILETKGESGKGDAQNDGGIKKKRWGGGGREWKKGKKRMRLQYGQ